MKPSGLHAVFLPVAIGLACACTPTPPAPAASAGAEQSILARSNPAAGSTVAAPLDQLELWFDPAARLMEVTVNGPEGMMPMMVTAVGEVGHYALPVSATDPGDYTVLWKASAGDRKYEGSFSFTLR